MRIIYAIGGAAVLCITFLLYLNYPSIPYFILLLMGFIGSIIFFTAFPSSEKDQYMDIK